MSEKLIWVKSNLPAKNEDTNPLALWEKDSRHPKGEVLISGDKVVQVFPTAEVVAKLRAEILVETDAPKADDEKTADEKALAPAKEKTDADDKSKSQTGVDDVPPKNDLPDGLPMRGRLLEQNITSYEELKKMSANQLIALKYINTESADAILKFISEDTKKTTAPQQ